MGAAYRSLSGAPYDSPEVGEVLFARLPTDFAPVQVSDAEFSVAMTTLWLDMPLRVAMSRPPLYVGRRLALASAPSSGEAWQSDLARAYGQYCERCGTPGDCLTLFEDGSRFQDDDKRSLALALAVAPALEGWEFFDLLRAYAQLYEDAPRASGFAELREIGERFGRVIGPNSVRILVIVATAAIGETAVLMSKGPKLPGFGQASRTVEASTGLRLMDAATGTERVILSVTEDAIRIVLPVNAVSMAARNGGTARPVLKPNELSKGGRLLSDGYRAFGSFRAFKRSMGRAGDGLEWHHLVEKHDFNLKRFGAEALHNTENVIPIGKDLHVEISAFYSSKRPNITSSYELTVREWIRTQSYEKQRSFALLVMEKIRTGEW